MVSQVFILPRRRVPPTFEYHTRHTCLRLRISRTAVLYLARASPVSLNPYNGVELLNSMHTPCLVREEFAITLTTRLRSPSLIAEEITGRHVGSHI